jgi:hypothetical protein
VRRQGQGAAVISRRDLLVGAGATGLIGTARQARAEAPRQHVWLGKSQAEIMRLVDEAWRDG